MFKPKFQILGLLILFFVALNIGNINADTTYGVLKVKNVDYDSKAPLPSVEFELYDSSDVLLGVYMTNSNGEIEMLAPYGTYYWQEKAPLPDYVANPTKYQTTILAAMPMTITYVENVLERADVKIKHVDYDTGESIPNTSFRVWGIANSVSYDFIVTTDNDGKLTIPSLIPGTYSIEEVNTPNGYHENNTPSLLIAYRGGQITNQNDFIIKSKRKIFITYYGNGNTSGLAPGKTTHAIGDNVAIGNQNTLIKDGYIFIGWNSKADGSGIAYNVNQNVVISGNLDLYAQYRAKSNVLSFDVAGGNPQPRAITANTGSSVDLDKVQQPKKKGYVFKGWYDNNQEYKGIITMPSHNLVLVAKWYKEFFSGNNLSIVMKDFPFINKQYILVEGKLQLWSEDSQGQKTPEQIGDIDLTKTKKAVGSYPIIISSQSEENYLIYLSIGKTKNPVTNADYALDASDITMSLSEYKELVKKGKIDEEILKRSFAKVWSIKTNVEKKNLSISKVGNSIK